MNVAKISGFSFQPALFKRQVSQTKPVFKGTPVNDTVSFSPKSKSILSVYEAEMACAKLKSATSGYRDSTYRTFDDKLVNMMTASVALWLKEHGQKTIMLGGDTRPSTVKYAPIIADKLTEQGFDVLIPQLKDAKPNEISNIPSPLLALATKEHGLPLSILLTASHNPWEDGGYCFLADGGSIATEAITTPLADNLVKIAKQGSFDKPADKKGKLVAFDPYEFYKKFIGDKKFVDFKMIKDAGIEIYYEALCGTGGHYFPRLMKDNGIEVAEVLNTKTSKPEPDEKNLKTLAKKVTNSSAKLKIGLATDGDSDRFGIVDENGTFISAHDVVFLAAYHSIKNKGMTKGTIIKNHATTEQIERLADYFNAQGADIDVFSTPVGFKYLGKKMLELEHTDKPVIVAGEGSGGFTVRDHIPTKDGFVALLTMLELMAYEKKPLGEILETAKAQVGADYETEYVNVEFAKDGMQFAGDRGKDKTVRAFRNYFIGKHNTLAGYEIDFEKTYALEKGIKEQKPGGDGIKVCLKNGASALIRESGTEPVLRLIIDAKDKESFNNIKTFLVNRAESNGGVKVG